MAGSNSGRARRPDGTSQGAAALACKLPARFVDDRIFLHPRTVGGDELTFYSDTGGGNMLIGPEAVRRLGLTPEKRLFDDGEFDFVRLPTSEFRWRNPPTPRRPHGRPHRRR